MWTGGIDDNANFPSCTKDEAQQQRQHVLSIMLDVERQKGYVTLLHYETLQCCGMQLASTSVIRNTVLPLLQTCFKT